jgi:hypothetical protein
VPALGRIEFIQRVTGLSAESRFMTAWQHGQGPELSVDESAALLDRI